MTGLSKITDKILAEAREDAKQKLAEADARCAEIAREYEARADEIRRGLNEDAKREAAEIVSRAKSSEAMIKRNVLLEAKSARVDEAFALAHQAILELSDEQYGSLLLGLLTSVIREQAEHERTSLALYGAEDAPIAEQYEVILNEKDRDRLGKWLIGELRTRMTGEERATADRVVLAKETAPIDGGLIVRCGSIEINSSLRALMEELRPRLEGKVSKKLFPDKLEKKGS